MNRIKTNLFISEINLMLDYCFYSFNQFNKVLHQMDKKEEYDTDYFWHYSQSFVTYAANLSKLLWATKNRKESQEEFLNRKYFRDQLREEIGVSETSILKDKKLRNRFEHIDEDMDAFQSSMILDRIFGPSERIINLDGNDYDLSKEKQFRHYNPETRNLFLYAQKMNLQTLYDEVKELSNKVTEFEKRNAINIHIIPQRSKLRDSISFIKDEESIKGIVYNLSTQLDRLENGRIYELNGTKWDGGLAKNVENLKSNLLSLFTLMEADPSLISLLKKELFCNKKV